MGILCFQSTQEGCAEELSTGGVGVDKLCSLPKQISSWFLSVLGERLAKGTECKPQSQCGRGCWATVEAISLWEVGDVVLTHFPIPNHTGGLKGRMDLKLGLMLILMSDPCDIQSQVTMTAWHECHPGFSSKVIAFWLSKNHASPYWVLRSDKKKELSCSCF